MNNIPDFVLQVQEVERNLKAEWQVVQDDWRDASAQNFDVNIMEPYSNKFQQYVTGEGIKGLGLDELLSQMDQHLQEMAQLTGVSEDVAFVCAAGPQYNGCVKDMGNREIDIDHDLHVAARGGVVHDGNRDRDYWNPSVNGAKPGELRNKDIVELFKNK